MPRKKAEQPETAILTEENIAIQAETEPADLTPSESASDLLEKTEQTSLPEQPEPNPLDEIPVENTVSSSDTETIAMLETAVQQPEAESPTPAKKSQLPTKKKVSVPNAIDESDAPVELLPEKPKLSTARTRKSEPSILTIASGDAVDTPDAQEETAWHEIRNAHRTHRILTGTLSGVEPTENGKPIAIVNYNEYRVVIPLSEMMINLNDGPNHYGEMQLRQSKILGNMIGAEIDFVIKGIESKSRSIVASRKDAMMRKRKLFYFDTDSQGMYRIYEDRIVQARVIAVAEKVIRVEVFGVECPILARDLSYNWLGDAHEYYHVGDEILVRIQQVNRESPDTLSIRADVRSISGETDRDNLKKCRIQGKYAGTVTDIHRGVVFVRLNIGVNAVAHSCYDSRMPGKKDEVSFAVTHLDEERNVAVGIITRIMRRKI